MSAFYKMEYVGHTGLGIGALYVGRGVIIGADAGGGYYNGTYTDQGGRLKGNATLSMPKGGSLVTGQQVPAGGKIPLSVDWPSNFYDGKPQTVMVMGNAVRVVFEKVGDIP